MPNVPNALEIAQSVRTRRVSAAEVVREALERIRAANPGLNAFIEVHGDEALRMAGRVDDLIASGRGAGLPLAGVPVAIKDNIALSFGRTTAGSRMLEGYRSPFSATAASRLIDAGAVVVGKTNMDEFGMGSSGERSAFGPTRNPRDPSRVPGGSSSGSAAAVAAGLVPLALGSDTGGSIRQPASHCGCVGLKPTYGRVSRWGLVAYASSLDVIGPLACDVPTAALALSVMAGHDPLDATSSARPVEPYAEASDPEGGGGLEGVTLGVPRRLIEGASPEVRGAVARAEGLALGLGARVVTVELSATSPAICAYYVIAPAEASSNLARYDGVRYGRRAEGAKDLRSMDERTRTEGFGPEVRRRIILGTHVLSAGYHDAYYLKAQKARRLIAADLARAFDTGDGSGPCRAILMPAAPAPAFRLGEKLDDPLAMYLEDAFTVGVSLCGLPALCLPIASAPSGGGAELPIGVQVIGRAFDEAGVIGVGRALEGAREGTGSVGG